jgi:hypothetical protein
MVVMAVLLIAAVLGVGTLFLRLHTLPERMAHKSQKLQFEIVAVLGLLALFTHIHLFWVAGLLLALIDLPDFGGPLGRIAGSVEKIAGIPPGQGNAGVPEDTMAAAAHGEDSARTTDHPGASAAPPEGPAEPPDKSKTRPRKQKEPAHA